MEEGEDSKQSKKEIILEEEKKDQEIQSRTIREEEKVVIPSVPQQNLEYQPIPPEYLAERVQSTLCNIQYQMFYLINQMQMEYQCRQPHFATNSSLEQQWNFLLETGNQINKVANDIIGFQQTSMTIKNGGNSNYTYQNSFQNQVYIDDVSNQYKYNSR
jgi:hypothetical protein